MRIKVIGCFLAWAFAWAPTWASPCDHTADSFKCVFFRSNHDGDTITVDIPNVHPLFGRGISIRLYGVDTPELQTSNVCEKFVGALAKDRVYELLAETKTIDLLNVKKGSFFRIVADVHADGVGSISDALLNEKLAVPFGEDMDWCQSSKCPEELKKGCVAKLKKGKL